MKNPTTRNRNYMTKVIAITLCLMFSGSFSLTTSAKADDNAKPDQGKINKILFLGNSITKHGPAPHIGWTGNWGMAASAAEKDYVHLVVDAIRKKQGTAPEMMTGRMVVFERDTANFDVAKDLKDAIAFKPDMVIIAVGENGGKLKDEKAKTIFRNKLMEVIKAFQKDNNPRIIIRSSFWPRKYKDPIFKEVAEEIGATYVDNSTLFDDKTNCAPEYEHKGVAAHPGDKGMQAIADSIIKAIEKSSN